MGHHHSKTKKDDAKIKFKKGASEYETLVQDVKNGKSEDDSTKCSNSSSENDCIEKSNIKVVSVGQDEELEEVADRANTNSSGTDDVENCNGQDKEIEDIDDHAVETNGKEQKKDPFHTKASRRLKSFATTDSGNEYIEIDSQLQEGLDKKALKIKEQSFFPAEEVDGDPPDNENSPSKRRYKSNRSQSRMKKMFSRTSGIKVAPIDNLDGHNTVMDVRSKILRTPSYIFDIAIIDPPPEFGDDELSELENESIYGWLTERRLMQVKVTNSNQTEPEYITVTQLYNSMSDGQKSCYLLDPSFLLLIDTRSIEEYKKSHINTAHHIAELIDNEQAFDPFDQYTFVVLYDDDGLSYSLTDSDLSRAMEELMSRKADAYVVEGGFDAFYIKFPYFCTDKVPNSEAERQSLVPNYPSIIVENQLFMGKVDQATDEKVMKNLGVTHIVCITQETTMPFKDFITYHHVKLSDEPSTSLHNCFPETIKFMHDATESGGVVLVHCNLGQSRSCTVMTAYLMFTRQWSLHDAYGFVKERRPVVHPNEGFMNQLSNFERVLFGKRITNIELYGYNVVSLKKTKQKESKKKDRKSKIKKLIQKDTQGYDSLTEDGNDSQHEEGESVHQGIETKETDEHNEEGDVDNICKCENEDEPTVPENNMDIHVKPVTEHQSKSKDDSESALLLDDDADEKSKENTNISQQRYKVTTPFINTKEFEESEERNSPKQGKKSGALKQIIVVSSTDNPEKSGKNSPRNVHAEGDDVSLIGDLNAEINTTLKGISNSALESENSLDKSYDEDKLPNEVTEITSF